MMFRKSSSVSAHLLTNGSCSLQDREAPETEAMPAPALPTLVYYAAVAKGVGVVSEYASEGNADLPAMAAACLENVPPLHVSFSYTTHQRRFVCLLDGVVTYCAITDEGLCKADAFSFLRKVCDAFKGFGKGRGKSLTLGAHFLDEEMVPVMRNLACSYVGVPQRERITTDIGPLVQRNTEDMEVSSPSAVAPLPEMTDHDCASRTEEVKLVSQPSRTPLIGKVRRWRKKTREQAREALEARGPKVRDDDRGRKVRDDESSLELVVDAGLSGVSEKNKYIEMQKLWRRKGSSVLPQGSCCYALVSDEGRGACSFKESICTWSA